MKNDNLTHDWLDYLSEIKSVKKIIIKEGIESRIIKVPNELNRGPAPKVEGIVIHHTATKSAKSTLSVLLQRGFSTNYEVDQQGNVYEYLDPSQYKALATGGNANEHTIGIDVTTGDYSWPEAQVNATKELVHYLAKKFGIQELKLAPDKGPKQWQEWQQIMKEDGQKYTLFRHRNFIATGCPANFPIEKLVDGYSPEDSILDKAYSFIKNIGSQAYDSIKTALAESIDKKLFDIQDNSEKQIYQKYQKYFDALLNFLKKELKITKPVKIVFEEDKKNSKKPLGRTGGYMNEENKIHIFVTGRHVKDIMRSLAHEMVHHRQNIRGEFKKAEPTTKGYAQKNPHLRKMEKEAFLKGNMLFRDWEDNYKYRGEK